MSKTNKILFISNLYPNPLEPYRATFNRQQLSALKSHCSVDIVSPVSWLVKLRAMKSLSHKDCPIFPTFFYLPGLLRRFHGVFYLLSVFSVIRRLIYRGRYDVIFASWLYPDGWAAAYLSKFFKIPLFIKVHGTDVNRLLEGHWLTKKSLFALSQARGVICVSGALRDKLISLGVDRKKLHVVYNGVDCSVFKQMPLNDAKEALNVVKNCQYILYVGNLKKEKGLSELIQAFNTVKNVPEYSNAKLVMVGDGPFRSELITEISGMGLENSLIFTGSLPLSCISLWMNACELLCLPSYMEGIPNVLLEAFACGTPVVSTNVGGIPELKGGERVLYLVEPRNVSLLTDGILACLGARPKRIPDPCGSWDDSAIRLNSIWSIDHE